MPAAAAAAPKPPVPGKKEVLDALRRKGIIGGRPRKEGAYDKYMREKRESKTRALLAAARRAPRVMAPRRGGRRRAGEDGEEEPEMQAPAEASQPTSPGRQLEMIARARKQRKERRKGKEDEDEENLKRYWRRVTASRSAV